MTGSERKPPQRPTSEGRGARGEGRESYASIYQFAQGEQHPPMKQLLRNLFSSFYLWAILFCLAVGLMAKHGIWPLD